MNIGEQLRWYGFWVLDALRGGKVREYYQQIKNGFQKGTSIEETQERIQKLITHAVQTTEYYKNCNENVTLEQLPVVNKETFRNHYEEFLSSAYRDAMGNRTMCTSGSTGTPLAMIQNRDKVLHNTAGGIFLGAAGGYFIGMREAFIRVWVNNVTKSKLRLWQENLIMMDSSAMDDAALEKMLRTIREKRVKCLVGYSSALGEISRYIEEYGMDMSPFCVKAIIPISESMPVQVREKLESQFGCSVRAWYSNEENGIMGLQRMGDESYYIDSESYYYEILKMDSDEPAEDGELGRIVITDLYNYAFPILRYDNGDTAVARRKVKGDRFKLYLTELYGRRSDLIYDCNGKALTPYIITNNMWDVKGVRQFRFIQEEETAYTLWLNGDANQIDLEDIRNRILPYLGEKAELMIEFVDEIPVLQSGKRKYIENRCEKYRAKEDVERKFEKMNQLSVEEAEAEMAHEEALRAEKLQEEPKEDSRENSKEDLQEDSWKDSKEDLKEDSPKEPRKDSQVDSEEKVSEKEELEPEIEVMDLRADDHELEVEIVDLEEIQERERQEAKRIEEEKRRLEQEAKDRAMGVVDLRKKDVNLKTGVVDFREQKAKGAEGSVKPKEAVKAEDSMKTEGAVEKEAATKAEPTTEEATREPGEGSGSKKSLENEKKAGNEVG